MTAVAQWLKFADEDLRAAAILLQENIFVFVQQRLAAAPQAASSPKT